MPPARLEPTIPASERPQTYAFDLAVNGIGTLGNTCVIKHPYAVLTVNNIRC
jgi:hypothetical protein